MGKYVPNVIKTDLGSYRHFWRGTPKIGKTTMFRDVVEAEYGDAKHGLLVGIGNETGHKALSRLYAVETNDWSEFVSLIDDLVENPDDNEFNLIGLDTVDQLVDIAIERTLLVHFKRKSQKVETINQALGGYGSGQKYVVKIINDQINRLERAGYGLVFIGHTKIRDIKEKGMDEPYQTLTTNLDSRYGGIFTDKADIVATFYDKKRVVSDGGVESERFIFFRPDGFVEAGSRFSDMPVMVNMSADNYLKAFNEGVKASFGEKVSDAKISKMKAQEKSSRKAEAEKYSEKERSGSVEHFENLKTVEDYKKRIRKELESLNNDTKRQKRLELKEAGVPTAIDEIEDMETLKTILKKLRD